MKSIKIKYAISTLLFIIVCSCNNTDIEREERAVNIKFNNGSIYCIGKHVVNKKTGEPEKRVGLWRFYYPNGKISNLYEYDSNGEMINRKVFYENGTLIYSEITNDVTTTITFYDNGQIESESVSTVELYGEDEVEVIHDTEKIYYLNGQLYMQNSFEDGILEGTSITYDSTGAVVLKLEYKNGFINTK